MTLSRYPTPLPPEFERYGFSFHQIYRTGIAAVYEVKLGEAGSPAYEVVKPSVSKTRFADGSWSPCDPYEVYPSSEMWGNRGWTFVDEEKAINYCNNQKK
jgi:hypothetical protein